MLRKYYIKIYAPFLQYSLLSNIIQYHCLIRDTHFPIIYEKLEYFKFSDL